MKKLNVKRILFVMVAVFALSVLFSSCKTTKPCKAYDSLITPFEITQNS